MAGYPPPFRPNIGLGIGPGIVNSFRRMSYRYIPRFRVFSYDISPVSSMISILIIVLLIIGVVIVAIYCGISGNCKDNSKHEPIPGPYPTYTHLSLLGPKTKATILEEQPVITSTTELQPIVVPDI